MVPLQPLFGEMTIQQQSYLTLPGKALPWKVLLLLTQVVIREEEYILMEIWL